MVKALFRAILSDLGYPKKSVELRAGLLERFAECERRGIDPFAELRKVYESIPELPALPTLSGCPFD